MARWMRHVHHSGCVDKLVIRCDILIQDGQTLSRNQDIIVENGTVIDIVPSGSLRTIDAHFAIITPVFHNSHSHVEYHLLHGVDMGRPFFEWVRNVVQSKSTFPEDRWPLSSLLGATALINMGYRSTEDCSDSGCGAVALNAVGLHGRAYVEVNGLHPEEDILRAHNRITAALQQEREGITVGVAPHALYSTSSLIFKLISDDYSKIPTCIHVDESDAEFEFTHFGRGEFKEMYERRHIEMNAPYSSSLRYLANEGFVNAQTTLIHGCTWDDEDIGIVRECGARWIVCPESNYNLQCKMPQVSKLRHSGIRIGIGTDSSLSCKNLSPFSQMQRLLDTPGDDIAADAAFVFQAATLDQNGVSNRVCIGGSADLVGLPRQSTVSIGEANIEQCIYYASFFSSYYVMRGGLPTFLPSDCGGIL